MAVEVNGFLIAHVMAGACAFVWGLWHLFNIIKLHAINPKSYTSFPWFPTSRIKYIELYLVISTSCIVIAQALKLLLFLPQSHDSKQFFPIIEHAIISLTFFVYGVFAILFDKLNLPAAYDLVNLIFALGFCQELLVFHLHSTDHVGVEGQYHMLFQIMIFVSFTTALLAMKYPTSFLNGFVRSVSILFQGVWFAMMGIMLFTTSLIPEGCYLDSVEDHWTVQCHEEDALHRAKSLANIQFGLCVIGVVVFSLLLYLTILKLYSREKNLEYQSLTKFEEDQDDGGNIVHDVESVKKIKYSNEL